jgi:nucleoside-diphosphate-sugar epimerase
MMPVLIFGAGGGVGLWLARLLREDRRPVFAMLRSPAAETELAPLGVMTIRGDAMAPDDVSRAFALPAAPEFDVVSTIGGRAPDGRWADSEGNANIIDRAAASGTLGRFVLVTSIGCGDMAPFRSARAIAAFGDAVDAKTRAEEHLRRAIPDATILRPGGLRSEPATGRGILVDDPQMHGFIHRADVADLVRCVLRDPATAGRTFAAVDRDQAQCANLIEPFPLAR